jgi:hypothetical protein
MLHKDKLHVIKICSNIRIMKCTWKKAPLRGKGDAKIAWSSHMVRGSKYN